MSEPTQQPPAPATPPAWSPDIAVDPREVGDLNIRTAGDLLASHQKLRAAAAPGKADEWYPSGDLVLGGADAQRQAKDAFAKSDIAKRVMEDMQKNPRPQSQINRELGQAYNAWIDAEKRGAENKTAMEKVIQERFGGEDNFKAFAEKVKAKHPEVAEGLNDAFLWKAFAAMSEFSGEMQSPAAGEGGGNSQSGGADNSVAPGDAPTLAISIVGADDKPQELNLKGNYKDFGAVKELMAKYGNMSDHRVKRFLDDVAAKQRTYMLTEEGQAAMRKAGTLA